MKKLVAILFLLALTMTVSAQEGIKVGFLGAAPDIMDFAWAWATANDDDPESEPDESSNALRQTALKWNGHGFK